MKRFGFVPAGLSLLAIVVGACGPDVPTAARPLEPTLARAAAAYTSVNIGALLGTASSTARGVNDAGDVAGWSCCGAGTGAFATVGGVPTMLGGDGSAALAIGNGTPVYVAGYSPVSVSTQQGVFLIGKPVRWTLGASTQESFLAMLADEAGVTGAALAVNDAGAAVGRAGPRAAMWSSVDGSRSSVAAPAPYVRGEGRGINNAGHAVFVFLEGLSESAVARGYLRLASGTLIELPPESGDVTTYANDISEVSGGAVYVAGTTRAGPTTFRSVRWKVDVATGQILATEVRGENSHGLAASDAGAVAGYLETGVHTPRLTAFLWRGTELLKLAPPRSGKDGQAWAGSRSGEFVAGDAVFGLTGRAVLWKILSP